MGDGLGFGGGQVRQYLSPTKSVSMVSSRSSKLSVCPGFGGLLVVLSIHIFCCEILADSFVWPLMKYSLRTGHAFCPGSVGKSPVV